MRLAFDMNGSYRLGGGRPLDGRGMRPADVYTLHRHMYPMYLSASTTSAMRAAARQPTLAGCAKRLDLGPMTSVDDFIARRGFL